MQETGETGRQDTSLLHLSSLTLKALLVILLCCQFVFNRENISVVAPSYSYSYSYYILQLQLPVGGLTLLCHATFQAKFNNQGKILDSLSENPRESYSVLPVEDGRPPEAVEVQGDL